MSLLAVEKVSYCYETHPALDNVDMIAQDKEFIGIIGPNGSGKTTLLKNICGILTPATGRVLLEGKDIREFSPRALATQMAVMGQEEEQLFSFTAYEMVAMGRHPHKKLFSRDNAEDDRLIKNALEQAGAADLANRQFSALSGGERQRVLIARLLAQQARILLLDEPTNHLDISFRLQLMEFLRDLGLTVIAAIHDLNLAAMYCHRLYVLEAGQIVCTGTPREVFTPQLLREVFHINGAVETDEQGHLYLRYISAL